MFRRLFSSSSNLKGLTNEGNNSKKDILSGINTFTKIHELGFVSLVDVMPRLINENQTGDSAIVQAARVSYGDGTKQVNEDKGLIRYLWREQHTSPFEMTEVKFHIKIPIVVERQWLRHRTGSFNGESGRYSVMRDEFYKVDRLCYQSKNNKQGRNDNQVSDEIQDMYDDMKELNRQVYNKYKDAINSGLSREIARMELPLSLYTSYYWKTDLLNLLKFLRLRMDPHAQLEIRDYANAIYNMIKSIFPYTCEAFEDYTLNSITLSGLEISALKTGDDSMITNGRERVIYNDKLTLLHKK